MKTTTILIPTDFSLSSLNAVSNLMTRQPDQKFNILMVHVMQLSDSISELLMLSRRASEYQHISNEFIEQAQLLRRQYKHQLNGLTYEFFYGSTVAVFKNYLEANNIDTIAMLKGYAYAKLNNYSIDPVTLIERSNYPIIQLNPQIIPMDGVKVAQAEREMELA